MEIYRTVSLVLWWLFVVACVFGILQLFKLLAKKLQQKYLRYVGIAAALFLSWMGIDSMLKLQIQRINLQDEAEEYRSSISESMDSSMIEAIKNHNSKVEELQSKVDTNPVIYWIMCGDYGRYEEYIVTMPDNMDALQKK
jgi:hypothetical protein